MIAANPRRTRLLLDLFRIGLSIVCLVPLACGDSRRDTEQVHDLGMACGGPELVVEGAVEIDEESAECDGVCLRGSAVAPPGTTSTGTCSCRCAGPAGTGPFCACAADYSCEHQLDELGLGEPGLAGSYCVARR